MMATQPSGNVTRISVGFAYLSHLPDSPGCFLDYNTHRSEVQVTSSKMRAGTIGVDKTRPCYLHRSRRLSESGIDQDRRPAATAH
jgi:hypothetical protein